MLGFVGRSGGKGVHLCMLGCGGMMATEWCGVGQVGTLPHDFLGLLVLLPTTKHDNLSNLKSTRYILHKSIAVPLE